MLVSIDESGLSERPKRVRAWAPAGQIPVIQFHFNWKHVPAIASLSCNNCLFRLHDGQRCTGVASCATTSTAQTTGFR